MIKSFLKDSLIYTIPAIFSRGTGILLLPIYTRIASPEDLGAFDLYTAFGTIIALTVAFEIAQAIGRYIPESNDILKKSYASTGLIFTVLTNFVALIIFFYFSKKLSFLLTGTGSYEFVFKLALISIFFNGLYYYLQVLLRFNGDSRGYAITSVVFASSNLIFAFLFGVIGSLGLVGIYYALILSLVIASGFCFILLKNSLKFEFRFDLLRKLLSFSIPLVPASALVFVSMYIDRFMINELIGLDAVGIYSIGAKLSLAAAGIMIGFQFAITPLVFKHYKEKDTPKNISKIFRAFVILSLLFFTTYSLFTYEILYIFVSPEFYSSAYVVPLLVLSFFFSRIYVFLPGITIKKKTYIILFINIIVAVLNIALNFYLIEHFGIYGAALASMLSYFVGFLFYIWFSQKLYFVYHNWIIYCFSFFMSCLLVLVSFVFIPSEISLSLVLIKILLVSALIGIFFIFRLIHLKDFLIFKSIFLKP